MGVRKRKGRSKRNARLRNKNEDDGVTNAPHTFVFHRGTRSIHVQSIIADLRAMLDPFTASNLRVTRRNVLRDITSVASVFHVTHLWIISRSSKHMYLRLASLPSGPTIKFKINSFLNIRDIRRSSKRPVTDPTIFNTPPLLLLSKSTTETDFNQVEGVMSETSRHAKKVHKLRRRQSNNDDTIEKLIGTVFRRSFPSTDVDSVKLNDVKRCVLLFERSKYNYEMRHYAIQVSLTKQVNSSLRKLIGGRQRSLPDLSNCSDVSDFVYRPLTVSDSENEDCVELAQDINRLHTRGSQSAVRLREIGPRLDLELSKIEDEICSGNRLWPPKQESEHPCQKESTDLTA